MLPTRVMTEATPDTDHENPGLGATGLGFASGCETVAYGGATVGVDVRSGAVCGASDAGNAGEEARFAHADATNATRDIQ